MRMCKLIAMESREGTCMTADCEEVGAGEVA
jgi:hypothetical protein